MNMILLEKFFYLNLIFQIDFIEKNESIKDIENDYLKHLTYEGAKRLL